MRSVHLWQEDVPGTLEDFRLEFFDPWHPRPNVYGKLARVVYEVINPLLQMR